MVGVIPRVYGEKEIGASIFLESQQTNEDALGFQIVILNAHFTE